MNTSKISIYKRNLITIACLLLVVFIVASCTKTETVPYTPESVGPVASYKITNVQGDPLLATINDEDKTITIYLPGNLYLTVLQPEIKAVAGYTLDAGSDTAITDMMDYFANDRDIKYTFTGSGGTKITYSLKIISQQAEMAFSDWQYVDTVFDMNTPYWYYDASFMFYTANPNFDFSGAGLNYVDVIKAGLEAEDGKEYIGPNTNSYGFLLGFDKGSITFSLTGLMYTNPDLPAGKYKFKVQFYSQTAYSPGSITLTK